MLDYQLEPPSKKLLKQHFIDSNRDAFPQDTLNCVAHLILAIEEPREMMAIALEFIVQKLSACRADIGFLGPHDPVYNPDSIYYNKSSDPPDYSGVVFSNQISVFQRTWRQRAPVVCDNVENNPMLRDSRRKFESIQSKSILFQRLTLKPDLAAGKPWRASSSLDTCRPQEHYCASARTGRTWCAWCST